MNRVINGALSRSRRETATVVDQLLAVEPTVYSPIANLVCVTAASWIYSRKPASVVREKLHRIGLGHAFCKHISIHNDGLFVASTAVLIQSECGRVAVLCYRGTEPSNPMNMLTDLDANPIPGSAISDDLGGTAQEPLIHRGFYRNLHATWELVQEGLQWALRGKCVDRRHREPLNRLEALFVTGHSLGAAMATLAGVHLATDVLLKKRFRSKLRGIYNYGQPMIGNAAFAAACSADPLLDEGLYRHIYGRDLAAHLMPITFGEYAHFGRELHASEGTGWQEVEDHYAEQLPNLAVSTFAFPQLEFMNRQYAFTQHKHLSPLGYSIYDHMPMFYLRASALPGASSRFQQY